MKRKLVFKYLFRSFWFSPWARELPNAGVCTAPPFQLLPFPGEQWSFFPDTLWKGWVKRSCGWWRQKLPQRFGMSDRQDGEKVWEEGPADLLLETLKFGRHGEGSQGKLRYTHPVIDYSAASQKHTAWWGWQLLFPFAAFGGRGGGSQGNSGQRWGLRGLEVRSHPAHKAYCSGICKPPFFFLNPVWDGQWCKVDPDKKEKMQPLMNVWRRRKNECRHYGQVEFLWANDFSILYGVDDMNTP